MQEQTGRFASSLLGLVLVVALTGCASMATPETPAQRLAYVDAQFAATVNTAADLRDEGVLGERQAAAIDPLIQDGDQALSLAWRALEMDRPEDALDYLGVVNTILVELRARLQEAEPDE